MVKIYNQFSPEPDFLFQISRGFVAGMEMKELVGHQPAISTTLSTMWGEAARYVFPPAATVMTVSSADVADDSPAGTGALTVEVEGLDATFAPVTEVVTLNGVAGVSTATAFLRVNRLTVLTVGTGGSNAGIVYIGTGAITVGKPAVVYNCILAGYNISQSGFYTTPLGKTLYLYELEFAVGQGRDVEGRFLLTERQGGPLLAKQTLHLYQTHHDQRTPWVRLNQMCDLEMVGILGAGAAVDSNAAVRAVLTTNDEGT